MLKATQGFTYNKFEKPNDWPKIDKTFDYQFNGNKLISGNENLYLSGPVTYTKVGNPIIKDNIISGFSDSSYIRSEVQLQITDKNYECVIKCTPHTADRQGAVFGANNQFRIYFTLSKIEVGFFQTSGPSNYINISANFTSGIYYYLKVKRQNDTASVSYSTDGIAYVSEHTITNEFRTTSGYAQYGYWGGDGWDPYNGTIDLSETYIKVNDRLWFYGKNYTTSNMVPVPSGLEYNGTTTPEIGWVYNNNELIKGPINYTKVGNPKIVNGVVSGFSSSDYFNISSSTALTTITSFVSRVKFKVNGTSGLSGINGIGDGYFGFYQADSNIRCIVVNFSDLTFDDIFVTNINVNTDYWFEYVYDNNTISVRYSTDGATWTSIATPSTQDALALSTLNNFMYGYSYKGAFNGSIDLNSTYIMVNGQPWFGYSSKFQEFTSAPQGTMIGKDETEMLKVETYQDKGIVDYTVVGSPTVEDGVVSGFSNSNYLQIPELPDAQDYFEPVNPFEMILNVNTDTLTRAQYLYYGDFALSITASKNLELYYYDGEGIFVSGTATLQNNTSYDIKLTYDGANIIVSYKTGNNSYTQDIVSAGQITKIADNETFGNRPTFNDIYLQGSIDLKSTYIIVNGQYWFHPYPNSFPKLVGPESYTEVGSPSITNGIITYTSSSDYIELNNQLTWDGSSNLEVYCRFKTPVTFTESNMPIISNESWSTPFVWIWGDSVYFQLPTTNISVSGVTTNTWYRIKIIGKNNTWTRILYTDDGTELAQVTSSESTGTALTMPISIFRDYNGNRPVESVDLNNTYIKVNGCMWFGKEDWEPSTYTDNSIYLLSGHSSDYSSYNELTFNLDINNSGTYSVTIDNQKVFTGMSRSTHIDWDKLALTTGYNITTPSSLKAHTIKISPENNSNNIIGYNCNYDYIIKDGKLIDANTNIYWQNLTGGGSGSDFAYIDAGFKPTNNTTFEFAYTQKQVQGSKINTSPFMINNPTIEDISYNGFGFNFQAATFNYFGDEKTIGPGEYNVKRIYKSELDNNKNYYIYKTEGGTTSLVFSASPVSNQTTFGNLYLGCWHYGYNSGASVPYYPMLGNLYYSKFLENGVLIRYFVPVPAGLVIGNFTVPSNGMFDIVNQQFHPNLGTGTFNIGRDN